MINTSGYYQSLIWMDGDDNKQQEFIWCLPSLHEQSLKIIRVNNTIQLEDNSKRRM